MTWRNPTQPATKYIGIDSGKNTGIAIWNADSKTFEQIATVMIHRAMEAVLKEAAQNKIKVRVEDARLRKYYGQAGREKLQGAGSIKRDAVIWEDFLKDHEIPFEMVAPKNNKTKLSKQQFTAISKYTGLTSEHSRDAAMLVIGM